MDEIFVWLSMILLVAAPLASVIWLYISWNRMREAVPFTPEYSKRKVRLIIVAVITGILVSSYIAVMAIYGVKVFFAA